MNLTLKQRLRIFLAFCVLFTACACEPGSGNERNGNSTNPLQPSSWYSVYFTRPTVSKGNSLRGGPDQPLADAIRLAHASVDIAVQQLDLWSIRDALLEAQRDGVKVRLVVESDYRDSPELQELVEAGIPVLGDRREGLMHNKFTIIDRQEVWTGSMNYTITDGYRNNNNLVRLRSLELAQNYTTEFEEMYVEDRFGPGSPANTPDPVVTVDGVRLEICFSPDDGCESKLVDLIHSAQRSVHFLAFSFTSDALADALIEQIDAGVEVSGVMEESQARSNSGTEFTRLQTAGADVRLDGNPRNMHHKVLIIDQRVVMFGSYNFSYFAENRNDENLILMHDPQSAALFMEEFEKVYAQAKP